MEVWNVQTHGQDAASVALQYYFSRTMRIDDYTKATQGDGIAKTYQQLFGNPWSDVKPHIPGQLAAASA